MSSVHQPWEIDVTIYQSEGELLAGLQRHEGMACACLLKQFGPRLLRFAQRLMGDTDEAEDVLQESLIAACGRIDGFEGRSGLGTWLHRIVLNTALMHLRRKQPILVSLDSGEPPADRQSTWHGSDSSAHLLATAPEEEPGAIILGGELETMVEKAIQALPTSLRTAFVLRDLEGLSTRAAARAIGIGEPALKVRLHRARQMLREALAPYVCPVAEVEECMPPGVNGD
jgi:RNA polymerase sigma-70 factor (ECF subfamily)